MGTKIRCIVLTCWHFIGPELGIKNEEVPAAGFIFEGRCMILKKLTSALAIFLCMALILSVTTGPIPVAAGADAKNSGLSNPLTDKNGVTTWDCVYFGNYSHIGGEREEAIKWRVLSVDGSDAFLMADRVLAERSYISIEDIGEEEPVFTWETCALRRWLNQDFYQNAFSQDEQAAILTGTVVNEDNAATGTDGGNNTEDKIYLLSVKEVSKAEYGFDTDPDKESGTRKEESYAWGWWLRTPCGNDSEALVDEDGAVNSTQGTFMSGQRGIRPVLHLNLDNTSVWSKADSVKSSTEAEEPTSRPSTSKQPDSTQQPNTTNQPSTTQQPNTTKQPSTTRQPGTTNQPNTTKQPGTTQQPGTATEIPAVTKRPAPTTKMNPGEKKAISSFRDLQAMEDIPSGSYYLKNDITVPENVSLFCDYPFTGTLDGMGHKLKGFTYQGKGKGEYEAVSIFGEAKNATFKNLSVTGVNINVNAGEDGVLVSTLAARAEGCKFDTVKVSGKITVSGNNSTNAGACYDVSGLTGYAYNGSFTNCSSSLKIKVSAVMAHTVHVSGLVGGYLKTMKNCSFSGSITASAKAAYEFPVTAKGFVAAGLCRELNGKVTGCVNSGNITLKLDKGSIDDTTKPIGVYGIGGGTAYNVSSCGNSGNIKISAPKIKSDIRAFGLFQEVLSKKKTTKIIMTKCWNTGNVSAVGGNHVLAAGLCEWIAIIDQCYNKGNVSGKGSKTATDGTSVGGICTHVSQMNNCYNVGRVFLNGRGWVGGLAAHLDMWHGDVTRNYSIGTVRNSNGSGFAAGLFLKYEGVESYMKNKCMVYNNYYKGCKRGCGIGDNPDPSVKHQAKSIKISSATRKNCPKLSSKYWVYSPKVKRLVLKNNNETKAGKTTGKKTVKKKTDKKKTGKK